MQVKMIKWSLGADGNEPYPRRYFMRIMALVLASALAVCFIDPASAATRRSAGVANPDRSVYPNSTGCSTYCYRGGKKKIQKQKKQ
jgi:hypothetical protein